MAEITARRQGEIVQAVFRTLAKEPEGLPAKEAITRVESALTLTDFERSTFPNNPDVVRFPKILRFATINSVKAGWLLKKNGVWSLTDEGRSALDAFRDPEAFFRESSRLYKEWKASRPDPEDDEGGPEESAPAGEDGLLAATTLEEAEEAARQAIRDYMATVNPYGFQEVVGKLLEAMGYHIV